VTEKSATPPNRPEPDLDPAGDTDEPVFEWMKPSGAAASKPAPGKDTVAEPGERQGRRAERLAAERRTDERAGGAPAGGRPAGEEAYHEALPTSALHVRPPQEEVERRNAEREQAANAKPVAPRVMQVLLAVCFPVILLVLAVRAVTSPLFLWAEYNRPGFPGDGYGFNIDDRMTYGSYAVDYLGNWSGPRYLGELVNRSGEKLFKAGEVSHMADVKTVMLSSFAAGTLLGIVSLVAILYLRRRSTGGVRRGLFAGSIATLVIIIGLGVLAVLGWEQFFTEFHQIFFANGTWTFSLQDTLIRLFPAQFWSDAGIAIGALVLLASLLTLILTWPTRRRRGLPPRTGKAKDTVASDASAAGGPADADTSTEAALKGRRFKRRGAPAADAPAEAKAVPDTATEPATDAAPESVSKGASAPAGPAQS